MRDWEAPWKQILQGDTLWKRNEQTELPMSVLSQALGRRGPVRLFVPLCGDAPISIAAFRAGWQVTGIDIVDIPLNRLSSQAPGGASGQLGPTHQYYTVQSPAGGRLNLVKGDIFGAPLHGGYEAVYDKDAFGAIPPERREDYVAQMARWVAPGGVVLLECKYKGMGADATQGPPFHFEPADLLGYWRRYGFELIRHWPSFYEVGPSTSSKQQAFLMRKIR